MNAPTWGEVWMFFLVGCVVGFAWVRFVVPALHEPPDVRNRNEVWEPEDAADRRLARHRARLAEIPDDEP
jgi:hypothetical protein